MHYCQYSIWSIYMELSLMGTERWCTWQRGVQMAAWLALLRHSKKDVSLIPAELNILSQLLSFCVNPWVLSGYSGFLSPPKDMHV